MIDLDDLFAKRPTDPLVQVTRQDLDPLSVSELAERIEILQLEITRVQAKQARTVNYKLNADALFK